MPPHIGLFDELSEWISLRVSSCREEIHGEDWLESKAHNDYDLWFLREGIVRLQVGERQYVAGPGDLVFFYPHMPYTAMTQAEGCRFVYAHFEFSLGEQLRILDDFRLAGIWPGGLVGEEAGMFLRAHDQSRASAAYAGARLYLKGCLSIVLAKIIGLCGQGIGPAGFGDGVRSRKPSVGSLAVLEPVFRHIQLNLNRSIRMNELAGIAGMSEKYFIAFFKKTLGITPGMYVNQIKMNRARDYLYQQKHSVQEISAMLGYPDPFTFSKAFKKYYNVPPSKFI
ncbi:MULTISPECIES: helix-turn-helix transcriptional regulator [Cohnella]|uniref:helix-turn-helix transcriptional regulator n=1 Tax=Cohnella TaxID=329857 RepID=UPI0009BB5E84|nr:MULTISPECIES: AraC family transcriptional regulator [Cohnella]MBN2982442.1 helix-turn-helix transcriptional regulator [Cohnella algarum]